MKYGCIGEHLSHSFSSEIHAMIGSYDYELCEIPKDELGKFLKERDFCGINVTIPYKSAIIPYLDEISDSASEIGAVNTIVNKNGKLCGYNTDFDGMCALIKKNGVDFSGKNVAVLGSGGTSLTALKVAESLGAGKVIRVSRKPSLNNVSYDELYSRKDGIDIIINTTPVGMYPEIYASPIDVSAFHSLEAVFDAVYNPLRTKLVVDAKKCGIKAAGGLYMLVSQAVFAAEHFLNEKLDESICDDIYKKLFKEKENIILTGMPGSGKTTAGKLVHEMTGKTFIDTDDLILKKANMPISDIFGLYGEEYFRSLEREVIFEAAKLGNSVIATGGGAILDRRNIDVLKENGLVFFLNRPFDDILPTGDRPLSSTEEDLKKRFEERFELYVENSDRIINDFSSPKLTALRITENFYEDTCD